MKPIELYERKPESESLDLNFLRGTYYDHLAELGENQYTLDLSQNKLVVIRFYKMFNFDARRFWSLASVWYEGLPVMIIQNAGREGDDHHERFITDRDLYYRMLGYIWSISLNKHEELKGDLVDPNVDVPGLTSFYGNSLDGHFEHHW